MEIRNEKIWELSRQRKTKSWSFDGDINDDDNVNSDNSVNADDSDVNVRDHLETECERRNNYNYSCESNKKADDSHNDDRKWQQQRLSNDGNDVNDDKKNDYD